MALNDAATLVIGAGNFFKAPPGTDIPADLTDVGVPWENLGHTSLEDIFGLEAEGGEKTVLGTLQNKTLRTKYSDRVENFTFTLQQFDEDSLKLYFGENMIELAGGALGVPSNPVPSEYAFLAIFIDGLNVFGFYAPRAEIFRGDTMSLSDTESLAGLPLSVTPLQFETNEYTYAVTPLAAA